MPTGKVKWYDAEKGFGFLSDDEGSDVFLHADALPEGIATLKGGTRVEFGIRFLAVWREDNGKWRLHAYQSARLPETTAPAGGSKPSP